MAKTAKTSEGSKVHFISTPDNFKTAHGSVLPKLQGVQNESFFQRLTILRPPVGSVFRDLSFTDGPGFFWDDFGVTLG